MPKGKIVAEKLVMFSKKGEDGMILAVSGLKNTGKSTLCRFLVRYLGDRGLRVGYVKHSDHALFREEGTDTGKILSQEGIAVHWGTDGFRLEHRGGFSPQDLVRECFPRGDLVLLEGGKSLPLPRIWVGNPDDLPEGTSGVVAWYPGSVEKVETSGDNKGVSCFDRPEDLGDFVEGLVRKSARSAQVFVGEKPLPLKDFVADFLRGSIVGMLRSLKGVGDPEKEGILVALPPERPLGGERPL